MAAITWKSLTGTNTIDPSRALMAAGVNINSGFDALQKALTREQEAASYRKSFADEAAKQSYLDLIQGAQTPEQLEALRASGQLQTMLTSMDPAARAAVRGADEARLATTRKLITEGQQFSRNQLIEQQRPITEQIQTSIAKGDLDTARGLMEANPNLIGMPEIAKAYDAKRTAETQLGQQNLRFAQDYQKGGIEIEGAGTRNQLANEQLRGTRLTNDQATLAAKDQELARKAEDLFSQRALAHLGKVGTDGYKLTDTEAKQQAFKEAIAAGVPMKILAPMEERANAMFDRLTGNRLAGEDARNRDAALVRDQAREAIEKANSPATAGSTLSVANVPDVAEYIAKITSDPKERKQLSAFLGEVATGVQIDGKRYDVPVDILKGAIGASSDTNTFWFNNRADNARSMLTKMMKDPAVLRSIERREAMDADTVNRAVARALAGEKPETQKPKK